jgi:hypothetical protein
MSAIHSHSHNHHNHSHNHSAANKAHYDSTAHDYDNIPMAKERSERSVPSKMPHDPSQ